MFDWKFYVEFLDFREKNYPKNFPEQLSWKHFPDKFAKKLLVKIVQKNFWIIICWALSEKLSKLNSRKKLSRKKLYGQTFWKSFQKNLPEKVSWINYTTNITNITNISNITNFTSITNITKFLIYQYYQFININNIANKN